MCVQVTPTIPSHMEQVEHVQAQQGQQAQAQASLPPPPPPPLHSEEVEEEDEEDEGDVMTTPNSGSRRTHGMRTPDSYESWAHGHGVAEFLSEEGLL